MTKQEKQAILDAATPRPWHKCKRYADDIRGGNDTQLVASTYDVNGTAKPNRELIVMAVNSYEADQQLIETMRTSLQDIYDCGSLKEAEKIAQAALTEANRVLFPKERQP